MKRIKIIIVLFSLLSLVSNAQRNYGFYNGWGFSGSTVGIGTTSLGTIDNFPFSLITNNITRATFSSNITYSAPVVMSGTNTMSAEIYSVSGSTAARGYFDFTHTGIIVTTSPSVTGFRLHGSGGNLNWISTVDNRNAAFTHSLTQNRTYAFPDASGTVALTSDLTSDWSLNGNAIASNTSFIGTTDNRSFRVRTNNVEVFKIDSVGRITVTTPTNSAYINQTWSNGIIRGAAYTGTFPAAFDGFWLGTLSQHNLNFFTNGNTPAITVSSLTSGAINAVKINPTTYTHSAQLSVNAGGGTNIFEAKNSTETSTYFSIAAGGFCTINSSVNIGGGGFGSSSLTIARFIKGTGTVSIGETSSGRGAFWLQQGTETATNYAMNSEGSNININTPGTFAFRTSGTQFAQLATTANGASYINSNVRIGSTSTPNATLDVTGTASISGNATFGSHIIGSSSAPTATVGVGAGGGATFTLTGNDIAGFLDITTAGTPTGSNATLITVTFASAFTSTPVIILTNTGPNSSALASTTQVYVDSQATTTTTFLIKTGTVGLTTGTIYRFSYIIIGK